MFTVGCLVYCSEKSGTSNSCKYFPTSDSVQNVNRMYNWHLWYWNSLLQYHLLWGEFSICALCCSYSQSLQFSFRAFCWVDRGGMICEACPTPLHMAASVLEHQSPIQVLTSLGIVNSVIWQELVTTWPCAMFSRERSQMFTMENWNSNILYTYLRLASCD